MSKLRVDFIDNAASQYDANASRIEFEKSTKLLLFLGDQASCSFVQIKARKVKRAICCSRELFGYCKENEVDYLLFDPDDSNYNESDLSKLKAFFEAAVVDGKPLLVFCESGIGKSAFVVAYLAMKFDNCKLSNIVAKMEIARGTSLKIKPSLGKLALKIETGLFKFPSMEHDGKRLMPMAKFARSNSAPKPQANNNGMLYAIAGVAVFFAVVYGVLYTVTGKV